MFVPPLDSHFLQYLNTCHSSELQRSDPLISTIFANTLLDEDIWCPAIGLFVISDLRQISPRIYCQLLLGGAPCPRPLATCRHVPRNVGGGTIPYLRGTQRYSPAPTFGVTCNQDFCGCISRVYLDKLSHQNETWEAGAEAHAPCL